MKPLMSLGLAAILASTVTLSGWANHGGCHFGPDQKYATMSVENKVERMRKTLDLSNTQADKITRILKDNETSKEARQEIVDKHRQLKSVLASPNSTKEQALRLQSEINAESQRLQQQHIEKMYEVRSVLTPEQREKFADKLEEHMQKRQARMEKWEARADKKSQQ